MSGKYNVTAKDGIRQVQGDEPCFVFRPTDQFILPVIAFYLALCQIGGASEAHIRGILRQQRNIIDWQLVNPTKIKMPD